jgi:alpha-glucoside transport system permease protein
VDRAHDLRAAAGGVPAAQLHRGDPSEVIEAARVDGAGHGQIFFRMILPLAAPALASFAVLEFIWVWNDLLVATIFAPSSSLPMTQSLNSLSGRGASVVPAGGGHVHLDHRAAGRVLRPAALLRAGALAGATKG